MSKLIIQSKDNPPVLEAAGKMFMSEIDTKLGNFYVQDAALTKEVERMKKQQAKYRWTHAPKHTGKRKIFY